VILARFVLKIEREAAMNLQSDITFVQKYLPTIKRVAKILGVAMLVLTVWKGVHGFFPTAGIIAAAVLYGLGDLL
jgi:hypothetical protein